MRPGMMFDMRTFIGGLKPRYAAAALLYALTRLLVPAEVNASFEQNSVTARSAGMSDAVVATVDDASALYYNPAGLVRVRRPEVASTYSRLFMGLSDKSQISRSFVGYAQPLKDDRGSLGVNYINLSLAGLYSEDTLGVSYARVWRDQLNYGASLKLLRRGFGSDAYTDNAIDINSGNASGRKDPVFNSGRSKTTVGLDLGAQYTFSNYYRMGFAIKNANQPNVGLAGNDKVPAAFSLGIGRKVRSTSFALEETMSKFGGSQDHRLSGGGERWFNNGLGVRAGFGLGSRAYSGLSAGAGYRMDGFQFDYALNYPLKGVDTNGTHLVSLTFRFGRPQKDPLEERLELEHKGRVRAEAEVARLKKKLEELMARAPVEPPPMEMEAPQSMPTHSLGVPVPGSAAEMKKSPPQKRAPIPPGVLAAYTEALKYFAYQVKSGAPIAERIATLKQILNTYQRTSIDMGSIAAELAKLQNEVSRVADDYKLATGYYRKIVQQGTSTDERMILLDRIIKKYKPFGVDTSLMEQELSDLRRQSR